MSTKSTGSKKITSDSDYKSRSKHSELEPLPNCIKAYTSPINSFMLDLLGEPRKNKDYTEYDKGLDNLEIEKLQVCEDVGPFWVTGLALAVQSLKAIMADIDSTYPDIYSRIGTVGMRSVRYMAGKKTISNHAWGCAIDLTIDGLLDPFRDDQTQHGLLLISPIFTTHRWVWGGLYKPKMTESGQLQTREDSMHFEVSKELLVGWATLGYLGPNAQKVAKGKSTIKVTRTAEHPIGNDKNQGKFATRLLAGEGRPPITPPVPKALPTSSVLMKPLPRRTGEPYSRWLGRTVASLAKNPSSWFR